MENARILAASIGTLLAWLVGGFDYLVQTLVIFIIIDYLSGIAAAWLMKELNSQKGLRGIVKKIFLLSLVVVAQQLDQVVGSNGFLRNAVLYTLIANETISILENCGRIGIPIPKAFYSALEKLKNKGDG
ncbi:toxin secretion/phage lysis holin [Syntrophobotulus glycolicus DSM 8271]|uniref:Toxin secretion/phage lysis holin n=1 Tax=Syntrophobotulus glycolicus (strain DSM 8271 / FlGlyR) TaxID=645991 RepID=F0SVM4_SYNGF|nr:phage holin family protein [Syntrophobotulus glycolicus]ADY54500.1 toxin secretion/phage lysis holin [Syntrophobotulus glycolicus DSM 8271]